VSHGKVSALSRPPLSICRRVMDGVAGGGVRASPDGRNLRGLLV
jgi:hypothetical protein